MNLWFSSKKSKKSGRKSKAKKVGRKSKRSGRRMKVNTKSSRCRKYTKYECNRVDPGCGWRKRVGCVSKKYSKTSKKYAGPSIPSPLLRKMRPKRPRRSNYKKL